MASLGTSCAQEGDKIHTCKSKEGLTIRDICKVQVLHLAFECTGDDNSGNAGRSKMARLAK